MHVLPSVKTSCRGMTLVEVILVMAILSVVMLAVMSLYIPAQRATVVQTQVTDIQSNLRLAMNRLSQDLLTAGFLVTGQPIVFESGTTDDPLDFTIRTRIVGQGFGRVMGVSAGTGAAEVTLTMASADMVDNFPVGSLVRLVEPVSTRECDESDVADPAKRVYTVVAVGANTLDLDDPNGGLSPGDINPEAVVLRVVSNTQPPVQTIRYRHADTNGDGTRDALLRIVNDETQFLGRNVSNVNFTYSYAPTGRVRRVDVFLSGQTKQLVAGDAIASAKTRGLESSVTLRNVF